MEYRHERFNSLAPRGANLTQRLLYSRLTVSTHSPRGGRTKVCRSTCRNADVSTHSPRGGRTYDKTEVFHTRKRFNSLAPRGANAYRQGYVRPDASFNSLAPRGANLLI